MAINKKQKENTPSEKNPAKSTPKYEEIHFVDSTKPVWNYSLFTEDDIENFRNGTHYQPI